MEKSQYSKKIYTRFLKEKKQHYVSKNWVKLQQTITSKDVLTSHLPCFSKIQF